MIITMYLYYLLWSYTFFVRFSISICTIWYGRYLSIRYDTGTRTARYQVVLSISTIDGQLMEKEEEGEEEKREIPSLPWFPARSIVRERFFAGRLPSPLGEMRGEKRRELLERERGDAPSSHGRTRRLLVFLRRNKAPPRLPARGEARTR
ncbi:hypothetical protein BHE74_00015197 [Ensete ventricosum]|nr:hypothetical protein BHE74_00015197 [Ensete ventricosum]